MIDLALAVVALVAALVALVHSIRAGRAAMRVRQLVRHLRYVDAPAAAVAGNDELAQGLRKVADMLDGVLRGRLD